MAIKCKHSLNNWAQISFRKPGCIILIDEDEDLCDSVMENSLQVQGDHSKNKVKGC